MDDMMSAPIQLALLKDEETRYRTIERHEKISGMISRTVSPLTQNEYTATAHQMMTDAIIAIPSILRSTLR